MASQRRHHAQVLCISLGAAVVGLVLVIPLGGTLAAAQTYTVIHSFTGGTDGANPEAGLTIDRSGEFYGTTWGGGSGYGTVFQLFRRNSNWLLNPLHSFAGGNDGVGPGARVVFGSDGTLYGTTEAGGGGGDCFYFGEPGSCGTVFSLRPPVTACQSALCPWTETILHRFSGQGDGGFPDADVIFDQTGALYSTTAFGGLYGDCNAEGEACGTAYKLARSGNNWTETVLYNFGQDRDGSGPNGVIFDNAGNLCGTTSEGGNNYGTVYQLVPSGSGWTETILFRFNGGSQGEYPFGGVITDNLGHLYGTTSTGGVSGGGTVFELTQSGGIWMLTTLHSFVGSAYGGPARSLVIDAAGNIYGTTYADGAHQRGNVFKLTHSNGGWTYASLYDFTGDSDGGYPTSNVAFDANGNLYGTTLAGGIGTCNLNGITGCGVVWEIAP